MRGTEKRITVALLGGNTVVGHALSLLLKSVGYDTKVLEAPPTGIPRDLLEGVDLLLISPGLTSVRRRESLVVLKGTRERMGVPVLELSSAIKEGLLDDEVGMVPWPINIEGLAREIEGALTNAVEEVQDEIGSLVGEPTVTGETTTT